MATDHQSAQEREDDRGRQGLPDPFLKQVKQALEHMLDLRYLQHHPLVQEFGFNRECSSEIAGQRLRQELAAAIETLIPEKRVSFHSPHARTYHLIRLHYVQGMTVDEAAHELGISSRQAYRDLRRGEESIAVVLWARRSTSYTQEPDAAQISTIQAEMAHLKTRPRPADMRWLLQRAQEAVARIASERDVCLQVDVPRERVIVSADPVLARQVLVSLLSYAIQQAQPGPLHLVLTAGDEGTSLSVRYDVEAGAISTRAVNPMVMQLADRLGWTVGQEDRERSTRAVALHIATHGPTVLVVDDNEGLVKLLRRYLTDQACRVVAATDGQEGLRLAQELVPDAIVLDVMMPEMDGWELLQRLRNHPRTAGVPVIICSVINDPGLAYSLGASLVLHKPVDRGAVLDALVQLGVV